MKFDIHLPPEVHFTINFAIFDLEEFFHALIEARDQVKEKTIARYRREYLKGNFDESDVQIFNDSCWRFEEQIWPRFQNYQIITQLQSIIELSVEELCLHAKTKESLDTELSSAEKKIKKHQKIKVRLKKLGISPKTVLEFGQLLKVIIPLRNCIVHDNGVLARCSDVLKLMKADSRIMKTEDDSCLLIEDGLCSELISSTSTILNLCLQEKGYI